jgi:hypothetical protein
VDPKWFSFVTSSDGQENCLAENESNRWRTSLRSASAAQRQLCILQSIMKPDHDERLIAAAAI